MLGVGSRREVALLSVKDDSQQGGLFGVLEAGDRWGAELEDSSCPLVCGGCRLLFLGSATHCNNQDSGPQRTCCLTV